MKSQKTLIPLSKLIKPRLFNFPSSFGDTTDPVTQNRCMFIGINKDNFYIPVGVDTEVSYPVWELLRDIGKIGRIGSEELIKLKAEYP